MGRIINVRKVNEQTLLNYPNRVLIMSEVWEETDASVKLWKREKLINNVFEDLKRFILSFEWFASSLFKYFSFNNVESYKETWKVLW